MDKHRELVREFMTNPGLQAAVDDSPPPTPAAVELLRRNNFPFRARAEKGTAA